jgi:hypothetical protein
MIPSQLGLRLGEKIQARVEEVHVQNDMLMSYQGHLFRVRNSSSKAFKPGDWIALVLLRENPVEFILYSTYRSQLDRLA